MLSSIILKKNGISLVIAVPDGVDGLYRGTRFDWSGVILSCSLMGHEYIGHWFDIADPFKHDNVSGPAEEFSQTGYKEASSPAIFFKPGIGLLESEPGMPYDWFHTYKIIDGGVRTLNQDDDSVAFRHEVDNIYDYTKIVSIEDQGFSIRHFLKNTGSKTLSGIVYCHNFFVPDNLLPGPETLIRFPFDPEGKWREDTVSAHYTNGGIAFDRTLEEGEKAYAENIYPEPVNGAKEGYSFSFGNRTTGAVLDVSCNRPACKVKFWSNHRVSCVEPYIKYNISPLEEFSWEIVYKLRLRENIIE